jgi:adenosylhomocysteine nucleosidase
MKLHRTISLQRPLLVVALEEEAKHLYAEELPVLVTGVGKICAAYSLAAVLARQRPSSIINLGTAGALRDGLSGTHTIGKVVQHDFNHDLIKGLTGEAYGDPIDLALSGPVLGSGDVFVAGGEERNSLLERGIELVDMEGYAVAAVARRFGLEVTLVKEVSDEACESAGKTWRDSLDECAAKLGAWVQANVADA